MERWVEAGLTNPAYVDELFSRYEKNSNSVDSSWFFAFSLGSESSVSGITSSDLRIYTLIQAYRTYGHLLAHVNPIATRPEEEPWQLQLSTLSFRNQELMELFPTYGILDRDRATLQEIVAALRKIYCDKIGIEYMELEKPDLEKWIQQQIESTFFKPNLTIDQKRMILQQLNRSELLESFIHTRYVGQKRFSIEGGETLIPMLEEVIETGSAMGACEFVIGMAHRGRINVLSNILRKSHAEIFSEFDEHYIPYSYEGSGDVKYHKGFAAEVSLPGGRKVQVSLAHNPSHLESVDSVVEGQTLARQLLIDRGKEVIPIMIHGDAAIAGQGVVYETMQLYQLPGYSTGGTLHFIVNNQIGFTTTPKEARSTRYCTDIARAFSAPVFHVNAEDPEGCVYATSLAIKIRQQFHCDVFIELNCYRKYGHNEGDEPAYTQPLEYQLIRQKRPIRELYRDQLIQEGTLEKSLAESLEKEFKQALHQALEESQQPRKPGREEEHLETAQLFSAIETLVPKELLEKVAERISVVPEGFQLHPKLQALVQERLSMLQNARPIDWGMAELLAYGTLLWEGKSIRLSGQDVRRGTFSHRHAAWIDQKTAEAYFPLNHLKEKQGRFDVLNSPLSEYAVLGFEFGYSVGNPDGFTIWEAQFGDFCNGAQVVIDQYLAASEEKWGQKCGLTLFLPHGYEGQGPEHSSARIERFLSLAGNDNFRIVNPTTPAQFFHLLRKQALNPIKKPLIIFTPKGLLRHTACVSRLEDLTQGKFNEILEDTQSPNSVRKLVMCSGRIFYDLMAEREKRKVDDLGIVRIEQLYPLHKERLAEIINGYRKVEVCFWVQEEPQNMGAWEFIHPQIQQLLNGIELQYLGRPRSASPATGSHALHKQQHAEILYALFGEENEKRD